MEQNCIFSLFYGKVSIYCMMLRRLCVKSRYYSVLYILSCFSHFFFSSNQCLSSLFCTRNISLFFRPFLFRTSKLVPESTFSAFCRTLASSFCLFDSFLSVSVIRSIRKRFFTFLRPFLSSMIGRDETKKQQSQIAFLRFHSLTRSPASSTKRARKEHLRCIKYSVLLSCISR